MLRADVDERQQRITDLEHQVVAPYTPFYFPCPTQHLCIGRYMRKCSGRLHALND